MIFRGNLRKNKKHLSKRLPIRSTSAHNVPRLSSEGMDFTGLTFGCIEKDCVA